MQWLALALLRDMPLFAQKSVREESRISSQLPSSSQGKKEPKKSSKHKSKSSSSTRKAKVKQASGGEALVTKSRTNGTEILADESVVVDSVVVEPAPLGSGLRVGTTAAESGKTSCTEAHSLGVTTKSSSSQEGSRGRNRVGTTLSGSVPSVTSKKGSTRESLSVSPEKTPEREHSPELLDPSDPDNEGFLPTGQSLQSPTLGEDSADLDSRLHRGLIDVGLRSDSVEISHVSRDLSCQSTPAAICVTLL